MRNDINAWSGRTGIHKILDAGSLHAESDSCTKANRFPSIVSISCQL